MKYAIVDKGNGTNILVQFKNIMERQEQQLRFEYEFPGGSFRSVNYPQARAEFGFRSTSDIKHPCELCDGKTFSAAFHAEDWFRLMLGDDSFRDHKTRAGVA